MLLYFFAPDFNISYFSSNFTGIVISFSGFTLKGKKQALLMDEPKSTALSLLFGEEVVKKTGFIVKVFSTEEAALDWIQT